MPLKGRLVSVLESTVERMDTFANSLARRINHPERLDNTHYVAFSGRLNEAILHAMREGYHIQGMRPIPNWDELSFNNNAELMLAGNREDSDVARIRSKAGNFYLHLPKTEEREVQLSLPLTSPTLIDSVPGWINAIETLNAVEDAAAKGYASRGLSYEGRGKFSFRWAQQPLG